MNPIARVILVFIALCSLGLLYGLYTGSRAQAQTAPRAQAIGTVAAGDTALSVALYGDTVTLAGFHSGKRLSDAQLLSYGVPDAVNAAVAGNRLWVFAWYPGGLCDLAVFDLPAVGEQYRLWLPVVME